MAILMAYILSILIYIIYNIFFRMNKEKSQHFDRILASRWFDLILYLTFLTLVTFIFRWTIR